MFNSSKLKIWYKKDINRNLKIVRKIKLKIIILIGIFIIK